MHIKASVPQDASENAVSLCVCVCVFVWDNGNPLMPGVIWYKLSGALFPFWPPVQNFDEDPEEKALMACTYCVNNGIVLETSPSSHLLLFHPHMQAVFHLSLLSSFVTCNCWDGQPVPPPLGGSRAICLSRLDNAQRSLSLSHTPDGSWWVPCLTHSYHA